MLNDSVGTSSAIEAEAPPFGIESRISKHNRFECRIALTHLIPVFLSAVAAKIFYIDFYLGHSQPHFPFLMAATALGFSQYLFFKKMGLFGLNSVAEPIIGLGKVWGALSLSFLILLGVLYLFKVAEFYSRGWLLCWFALSIVTIVAARWHASRLVKNLIATGRVSLRVALVGSIELIDAVRQRLSHDSTHHKICGIYVMDAPCSRESSTTPDRAIDALRADLGHRMYERVIVALPLDQLASIKDVVRSVASFSVEVVACTDASPFPLTTYGSLSVGGLRMPVVSAVPAWEQDRLLKYMLDYSVAIVGLIVLAPLFALIAVAIKLESAGPVFFRQRRYGYNNCVFHILKFRTMTVTEDGTVVTQAVRNDARVTRIGRFLRASSIDELPQLINVLLGDMSIVGPRPHALAHDDRFERSLDLFSRRRRMRPGITGWAQVNGYRGETRAIDDVKLRMEYDLYYIDNWSIWFDVEIMARTVLTVARGAY